MTFYIKIFQQCFRYQSELTKLFQDFPKTKFHWWRRRFSKVFNNSKVQKEVQSFYSTRSYQSFSSAHSLKQCWQSVFPTVWNKIRPNLLKITANSAKIIFKFGHNSATFLANFDPIFSFYCIFMWQFFSNYQNLN